MSNRDRLAEIQLEHVFKAKGRNLGQYRAEYDCACGMTITIDGYDPNRSNLYVMQALHIADAILTYWKSSRASTLPKVR